MVADTQIVPEHAHVEPTIVINGKQLTSAQAMAVRVAVCAMVSDLNSNGLGDDDHGRTMTRLYLANLQNVQAIIHENI